MSYIIEINRDFRTTHDLLNDNLINFYVIKKVMKVLILNILTIYNLYYINSFHQC